MICRAPHCQRKAKVRGLCTRDYYRAVVGMDAHIAVFMLDARVDTASWDPAVVLACECDEPRVNEANDFDDQCYACFKVIPQRIIDRRERA